jgi:cytochrome c-type biogenesis protein CcmH
VSDLRHLLPDLRLLAERRARVAIAVLALALASPATALAASCPRTSVADIEDEVMCPVCKTPLGLAQEAPQADRERAFILARVGRCESKDEIKAALAAEFGDEVLALPERRGFDLAAYLVPALAFVAALAACSVALVRWRRRRPRTAGGAPTADRPLGPEAESDQASHPAESPGPADARARLERDLGRYDL